MKKFVLALVLALVPSLASASTFLQFNQIVFNQPFVFTTNGALTQTTLTAAATVNVTFDPGFCLVAGCGGATNGLYQMVVNAASTNAATLVNAGQDINQNFAGTISLTNGAINLLTVNFTDLMAGSVGGGSPTLAASQPPDTFTGSSTVFDPNKLGIPRGFSIGFSNFGNGGLGIAGTTIRAGSADGVGTFNATPTAVPEPASMLLLGSGLIGIAVAVRRRRKV